MSDKPYLRTYIALCTVGIILIVGFFKFGDRTDDVSGTTTSLDYSSAETIEYRPLTSAEKKQRKELIEQMDAKRYAIYDSALVEHGELYPAYPAKTTPVIQRHSILSTFPTAGDVMVLHEATLPATYDFYLEHEDMPPGLQDARQTALTGIIGEKAFSDLVFMHGIKIDPPHDLGGYFAGRPVGYYIVMGEVAPVAGVSFYEGRVWLDAKMELIDAEFPAIEGGFSDENHLGVQDVLKKTKQNGFVEADRLVFKDGGIYLWAKTQDKCINHVAHYKIAMVDMRNGEVTGTFDRRRTDCQHF